MTNIEKTVLQQISDVAWLVHQGPNKLGILNKGVQENFTYITGKELLSFKNEVESLEFKNPRFNLYSNSAP